MDIFNWLTFDNSLIRVLLLSHCSPLFQRKVIHHRKHLPIFGKRRFLNESRRFPLMIHRTGQMEHKELSNLLKQKTGRIFAKLPRKGVSWNFGPDCPSTYRPPINYTGLRFFIKVLLRKLRKTKTLTPYTTICPIVGEIDGD